MFLSGHVDSQTPGIDPQKIDVWSTVSDDRVVNIS